MFGRPQNKARGEGGGEGAPQGIAMTAPVVMPGSKSSPFYLTYHTYPYLPNLLLVMPSIGPVSISMTAPVAMNEKAKTMQFIMPHQ